MSENKVWAVSSGEYSDYGVCCIVPSEEIGEAIAAAVNAESSYADARVQEFMVCTEVPELTHFHNAQVGRDGTKQEWVYSRWPWESSESESEYEVVDWPNGTRVFRGTDAARVYKAAGELQFRILSEKGTSDDE